MSESPGPTEWADRLEALAEAGACVERVVVVAETASTQDLAKSMAGERPGLLVTASRQSGGRGRFGRVWTQAGVAGVAATFVLDGGAYDSTRLSLAAGVAGCRTAERALGLKAPLRERMSRDDGSWIFNGFAFGWVGAIIAHAAADFRRPTGVGLRWPNDVVEARGRGRKIAGVLVERSGSLALVGIGINVLQTEWPEELEPTAVSLRQLGSDWDRIDVLEQLVVELTAALSDDALIDAWRSRDVLIGTVRTFEHGGVRYVGRVAAVRPDGAITLRTEHGPIHLPAGSTSVAVSERAPGSIGRGPLQDA